jgi:hypothetical protein
MKARYAMTVLGSVAITTLLVLVAPPAPAQTGYPPGPATTQPSAVNGNQDAGTVVRGSTVTRELCGFAPGSTVRISVNGSSVPTMTADANGCVTVQSVAERCGANELTASGAQADGTPVNQRVTFTVSCGTSEAGTAFTGANIARGTITGAALIGVGALVVLGSRRRRPSEL